MSNKLLQILKDNSNDLVEIKKEIKKINTKINILETDNNFNSCEIKKIIQQTTYIEKYLENTQNQEIEDLFNDEELENIDIYLKKEISLESVNSDLEDKEEDKEVDNLVDKEVNLVDKEVNLVDKEVNLVNKEVNLLNKEDILLNKEDILLNKEDILLNKEVDNLVDNEEDNLVDNEEDNLVDNEINNLN